MEFWTTLIKVLDAPDTLAPFSYSSTTAKQSLEANCTHVTGPYWIMEGDVDALRDDGVKLDEIAEGAVGALGDLTEKELKQVCLDSYGVKL